jgi:Domain of unknown function (DUF4421)
MGFKGIRLVLLLITANVTTTTIAQKNTNQNSDHDSSYYQSFGSVFHLRTYFTHSYANFQVGGNNNAPKFLYKPNSLNGLGIGFTYENLTLNLTYRPSFLNNENGKGKTRYFDIQPHLYGRVWAIDMFAHFYKGYYLTPRGLGSNTANSFYLRPDMRLNVIGTSVARIMNPEKFSYRAAYVHDEWQKKPAGSILFGAQTFYGAVKADSSFIPLTAADNSKQKGLDKIRFFEVGPGAGYTYTYVFNETFFANGSLMLYGNLGIIKEFTNNKNYTKINIAPDFTYRFSIGYSDELWTANAALVGNQLNLKSSLSKEKYALDGGSLYITFTRRFLPKKIFKQKLNSLQQLLDGK